MKEKQTVMREGWTDGWEDEWEDGRMDRGIERGIDRWMEGWMVLRSPSYPPRLWFIDPANYQRNFQFCNSKHHL